MIWPNGAGSAFALGFDMDGDTIWKCRNCGYIHEGPDAPEVCPCCAHPKAYFERKVENY